MVSVERIIRNVSDIYGITYDEILERNRKKNIVRARQVCCYLIREVKDMSFPQIGDVMGGRDHTTAIHSYRKISSEISKNPKLRKSIYKVAKRISEDLNSSTSEVSNDLRDIIESIKDEQKDDDNEVESVNEKEIRTSEDLFNSGINLELTDRESKILDYYKDGKTLETIGEKFNLSRERIRQLVERAWMKELGSMGERGLKVDIEEYKKSQRKFHRKARRRIDNPKKSKIKNDIDSLTPHPSIWERLCDKYDVSISRLKENFPELQKKIDESQDRWSWYYTSCRGCGTTSVPHHRKGYCEDCLGKPQGERRERVIKKHNSKCDTCGLDRGGARQKYGRDLYLSKDMKEGPGYMVLCRGCFSVEVGKIAYQHSPVGKSSEEGN